jgi:hypothetical protein
MRIAHIYNLSDSSSKGYYSISLASSLSDSSFSWFAIDGD